MDAEIRDAIQALQAEVQGLRSEVRDLKDEVRDLKGEVRDLKVEVKGLRRDFDDFVKSYYTGSREEHSTGDAWILEASAVS